MIDDQKEQEILDALQHVLKRLENVNTVQRGIMARLTKIEKRLGLIDSPKIGTA